MTIKRRREPLEPLIVDILRAAGRRGLVLVDIYRQLIARGVDCCDDGGGGGGGGGDDDDDGHRPHIGGSDGVAWRKNVRHILTVREFFVKTGVKNPEGRGQYWRFDEGKYEEYVGDRRKVASAASGSSEAISNHDEIIDDAFDCVATSSQFVDQQVNEVKFASIISATFQR
jgi:hypothetical protein